MDQIIISDLELNARIGCTAEERAFPQRLHVSAEVGVDNQSLLQSLELSDGVCYATLSNVYREVADSKEWVYVEELLEEMSIRTFSDFSASQNITLSIKKYAVPGTESVGLRISRERSSSLKG